SYLFGTIHTLPGSLLDSIPSYQKAEAKCQQLFAEMDITDQQKKNEFINSGQEALMLPDSMTIYDLLTPEQLELLKTVMAKQTRELIMARTTDEEAKARMTDEKFYLSAEVGLEQMKHLMPLAFSSTIDLLINTSFATFSGTIIDQTCIERAKERNMAIGQLDQVQQDSVAKMRETLMQNIPAQVDTLVNVLNTYEQRKQRSAEQKHFFEKCKEYWMAGDYEGFMQLCDETDFVEKSPQLLKARNEKWLPKIKEAMKAYPTIFAFGAGHLVGPSGVVQMLRDAGYKVKQIK
ncbi:MAG: TraB/GumN family protein, partial [Bacteroidaceae bacterium]|nr:TraB/GumN family protein [Bacteroidaceae bacterium]